jgi:hypothetical protein
MTRARNTPRYGCAMRLPTDGRASAAPLKGGATALRARRTRRATAALRGPADPAVIRDPHRVEDLLVRSGGSLQREPLR